MGRIDQTARTDLKPSAMINSNVEVKITSKKFVSRLPDLIEGKKKPKGREIWAIEADGLGGFEVEVEVPAKTHAMKDKAKREAKVADLAKKAAAPQLEQAFSDHVN